MAAYVNAFQVNPTDDVATLLDDGRTGDVARARDGVEQTLLADIPRGHKVALRPLRAGEPVRRYGQVIGFATEAIAPGAHVHTHNLGLGAVEKDYAFGAEARPVAPAETPRTFMGYARPDGRVGTRNTVLVIAAANCAASVVRKIAATFDEDVLADYPNVDAVAPVIHWSGCGLGAGEELAMLRRTLAGFARHPNVAGCVLVGLGCEVNQMSGLLDSLGLVMPGEPVIPRILIQDVGGVGPAVRAGVDAVYKLLERANECRRTEQPASRLTVALECGGSDAYSGLTANPAVGAAADKLVAQGGTVILSETPEIYGAEHLLTRRAVSEAVGRALVERIHWWEDYAARNGVTLDNNPSPGNKAGGLTTIYEKSLGAVSKGGSTPLVAVYRYAERVTARGLCFMDTPGYDPVSVTGMVAGGATVIVFTTGRGSVFGIQPAPTVKVATNTPLYERMSGDMDIDAGRVISAGMSVKAVGAEIFEKVLATASGERTKGELAGVGADEVAPWIPSATL